MKYIVLSFDDGSKDFYTRAMPVLNKYKIPAVVNIITDFIDRSEATEAVGQSEFMSWDEVVKCREAGIEIANHSAEHTNNVEDIIRGGERIKACLHIDESIGFASPHSGVCTANLSTYKTLMDNNYIRYIRSGNVLRRDGLFYLLLYLAYKYTGLSKLFYWYNKRNIIMLDQTLNVFPSVACNCDNTVKQIVNFIEKMPGGSACVIMLHKILNKEDDDYGTEKWANTVEEFDLLCRHLSQSPDIKVITHKNLCEIMQQ